ncbi:MAG: exodeoxyribonuclease VII small subunit [Ruaniaceae bacterium]|nr:exodeoxyribonuclease VII small subunit [Ruaniaceae bacterium]
MSKAELKDIEKLSYEDARDQLVEVVRTLEAGNAPLEQSMKLWERGEALATHCQNWLDGARKRLDEASTSAATDKS